MTSDQSSEFVPFTKAQRIQQLNDVDKKVTSLLQSAGLALQALTASQDPTSASSTTDKQLAFQASTDAYLKTLQAVEVQLERHITGLEEELIIPKDAPRPGGKAAGVGLTVEEEQRRLGAMGTGREAEEKKDIVSVNEGAIGKLDLGWLNSRAGKVDRGMEAELWKAAKTFLEEETGDANETTNGIEDHDMER